MRFVDFQESHGKVDEQLPYDALQVIAKRQQNMCKEFKTIADMATNEGDRGNAEDAYRR